MLRRVSAALFLLPVAACIGATPDISDDGDTLLRGRASGVPVDTVDVARGVPSAGRDPAVVVLDLGGEGFCSGTLVAPSVVLTARHCVSRTEETVTCPATSSPVIDDRDAASLRVLAGEDIATAREVARGAALVMPSSALLCDDDLAFVVLDRTIDGIDPLPLGPKVRAKAVRQGDHVRSIGFGRRGDGESAGEKIVREHVRVLSTTDAEFMVGESTCQGDSGGPAIDEDSGAVLGVVSRGGPTCEGHDARNVYTRVDAFQALAEEAFALARETADLNDVDDDDDGDSAARVSVVAEDDERGEQAEDDEGADERHDDDRPEAEPGVAVVDTASGAQDGDASVKASRQDGGASGRIKKPRRVASPRKRKPLSDMGSACTSASMCAAGVCVGLDEERYCSRRCGSGDRCPTGYRCKASTSRGSVCMRH